LFFTGFHPEAAPSRSRLIYSLSSRLESIVDVYLQGKRISIDPSSSIGKGGEADVYRLDAGAVLKVWKTPDHPDYTGQQSEQEAARQRIELHQQKMRAFPRGLPARVVAPLTLATDRSGKRLTGFTMAPVDNAEALMSFGDPSFRARGLALDAIGQTLADLHRTVEALHAQGVVIGDFNDLNVLVRGGEAHLIDADSFQFGAFLCRVFTERFVDPLLCDPAGERPVLGRPYSPASDWYAFAVMVMQSLLCVGPYGGLYRPGNKADKLPQAARPLRRITVFHPEVLYPRPAVPYRVLPDELLQAFHLIFEKDRRGGFPRALLDDLRFSTCPTCGLGHARAVCPSCQLTPPAALKSITTVRGEVSCARIKKTRGLFLAAAIEQGELLYLVHEEGQFRREDGRVVMSGAPDPFMRFALQGETTLVGRGGQVVALSPAGAPERLAVDCFRGTPVFAVNGRHRHWLSGGTLLRAGRRDPGATTALSGEPEHEALGEALAGQTLFWVGERFGFGFYRAGQVSVAFVFDAGRAGLKDTVKLPFLGGQLIDATCTFGGNRAWVLLASERAGRRVHQCVVVSAEGVVEAAAEADEGDGSWLGNLQGKCAAGASLLSATDTGLVRVEVEQGALVEKRRFPDTEPFLDQNSRLLAGPTGLYVIEPREIKLLKIS
jgi:tRNA A-37 threonylcarbamoyl transferase component Bud32